MPVTCRSPKASLQMQRGITPVHVNRVLQQMRAEGLIEMKCDRLNIPDRDRLKEVGEFNPTYLHLESDQAAA